MTPREAFLGPQEVVATRDASDAWPRSRSPPTPPGIPNVLPGERLTAETLEYIEQTLDSWRLPAGCKRPGAADPAGRPGAL